MSGAYIKNEAMNIEKKKNNRKIQKKTYFYNTMNA